MPQPAVATTFAAMSAGVAADNWIAAAENHAPGTLFKGDG
jgi:hypothetical protein